MQINQLGDFDAHRRAPTLQEDFCPFPVLTCFCQGYVIILYNSIIMGLFLNILSVALSRKHWLVGFERWLQNSNEQTSFTLSFS